MHLLKAHSLFEQEAEKDEALLWQSYWHEDCGNIYRARLVEFYTPFTRKISLSLAIKFRSLAVAPEDCYQNGLLGLLEAIERFKPGRKAQFKTYAAYRIRGSVLNGIAHYNEQTNLLASNREVQRERVSSLIENQQSGADGFDQIIDSTLDLAIAVLLDEVADEDLAEIPGPYQNQDQYILSHYLFDLAMALPEREAILIFYHYFLGYRFNEVGKLMHISRSRVSQLHARALRLIRDQYAGVKTLNFKV